MEYEAGTVTKNGQGIPIKVNEDGEWLAKVGNDHLRKPTRSALVSAIERLTKRAAAEVAVPFVEVSQNGDATKFRFGVAYGVHSGTGNLLVVWKNGTKEQYRGSGWNTKVVPGDTSEEELWQYKELRAAVRDAERALRTWEDNHKFDLKDSVEAELSKAAEAAGN